jgi:hypothetical protein
MVMNMTRYALVQEDGLVINVIELEEAYPYDIPLGCQIVNAEGKGDIGDRYENGDFIPQPTPKQDEVLQLTNITTTELQIVQESVLAQRIGVLEAQIADMWIFIKDIMERITLPLEQTRETPIDPAAEIQ